MRLKIFSVILLSLFVAIGCQKSRKVDKAAPDVRESFVVLQSNQDMNAIAKGKGEYLLGIKKSSLGKEFLISQAMISQDMDAFTGLKAHVVRFIQNGKNLTMVEANATGKVTPELTPDNNYFVLAQFPILEEQRELLIFDFNAGLKELFLLGDWHATEETMMMPGISDGFESYEVKSSFIKDIVVTPANSIRARQFARLSIADPTAETPVPPTTMNLEMRYFITPYSTSRYEPLFYPTNMNKFGFFINSGFYKESEKVYPVTRHNPDQVTVYAISANTPAKYRQAIRDGVLYWNHATGRKIVDVIDAPEGVTAPDDQYNIIQWIENDKAGFAYADVMTDPRTGEILHTQIYLTSVFATMNEQRLTDLIKESKNEETKKSLSHLCSYDIKKQLRTFAEEAIRMRATPEIVDIGVQNTLRAVTAHEVGHTMGLRHNFAGTLSMDYDFEEREKMVRDFYLNGNLDTTKTVTSSVMDYIYSFEDILAGERIAKSMPVGDYDTNAMQILYNKADEKNMTSSFCSDFEDHVSIGCNTFDLGPLSEYNTAADKKSVSTSLLMNLEQSIRDGSLDLTAQTALIKSLAGYKIYDTSLQNVSGADFSKYFYNFDNQWKLDITELARQELKLRSKTDEEIAAIFVPAALETLLTTFQTMLIQKEFSLFALKDMNITSVLGQDPTPAKYVFVNSQQEQDLANVILNKVLFVILDTKTTSLDLNFNGEALKLPQFSFPLSLRVQAAELLEKIPTDSTSFAFKQKIQLKKQVKAKYLEWLNQHPEILEEDFILTQEGAIYDHLLSMKLTLDRVSQ